MQGKRKSSRVAAKRQTLVPPPTAPPPSPAARRPSRAQKAVNKGEETASKQRQKEEKQLRKYRSTIEKCDQLMTKGKFMRAIPDLKKLVEEGRFMEDEVFKGVGCVENWRGLCRGGAQEWYSLAKREEWIATHPLDLLSTCFSSLRQQWIQLHHIALPFFEALVRARPNCYELRVSLGCTLFSNEQYLQAEQQFLEAVKLNPHFEKTHEYLAWIYGYIFDVDKKAIMEADLALAINPKNFYAKYVKAVCLPDKAERLKSSRELIEERPDYYRTNLEIAKFIEEDGDEKRGYLMKIIDYDPKYVMAYLRLGTMEQRLKNKEKALEYYETAKKIDPRQKMVDYYMASFYEDERNLPLAIKYYNIACREGRCMDSYKALGLLYKREGLNRQAIIQLNQFMNVNPYDYDVVNTLGLLYDEQGNRQKAEEYFRLGIQLQPENYESYLNMGAVYQQAQRYEEAKEFYLKSSLIEPKEADVYYGLAICCGEQSQFAEALSWGQKCVSYGGDTDKEVYEYMGDIHLKSNNYAQALRWYLRHVELIEQLKSENVQTPLRSLHHKQAIEIVNSFVDRDNLILELQLALICVHFEEWDLAESKFEKVRELCRRNGRDEPEEMDFFYGQGSEWAELKVLGKRSLKDRLRLNRLVKQFEEKVQGIFFPL